MSIRRYRFFIKGVSIVYLAILYYLLKYIVIYNLLPSISRFPHLTVDPSHFFLTGIWWIIHYMLYAWFYWYYHKSINLQAQNFNLHNQKLKLQYNYLQAQINPHFLYNTLNFLYTEAQESNEKLADAIIALSRIMRYSIAEGNEKDTIALEQEVEVLDKYILLHQLRFDNQLNIQFTKEIEKTGIQIPPYILITLVENAFKHGQFSKEEETLYIHLHCTDTNMVFYTENTINPLPKHQSGSGVGLTNVAERLRLTYNGQQHLQYYMKENRFIVRLEINFAPQKLTAAAV
jgi:two-component system, LytTR family, sensor kinase